MRKPLDCIPLWRRAAYGVIVVASILLLGDGLIGVALSRMYGPSHSARRMYSELNNLLPHPDYIWTYMPGSRVRLSVEGFSADAFINQDGLRDEVARPNGRYFLAVGDSFTFGWPVALQDTWHKRLAIHLSQAQEQPIASVNLGMWMSTFSQHYLRLREMLEYYPRPEFVVHLVYPSHVQTIASHLLESDPTGDIVRARSLLLHVRDGELYYGADKDSLLGREMTWPYSIWWVRRQIIERRFVDTYQRTVGPLKRVSDLNLYTGEYSEVFSSAWDMTERSLSASSRLLRTRGIPYVVAIIPRDLQVARSEWNGIPPDGRILEGNIPQERLLKICRGNGIICLDLLPHFRASASTLGLLYLPNDPHWTPAGHELAARRIADFIHRYGLGRAR